MDALRIVRANEPDEVREFELGRLELYRIGSTQIGRAVYEPGWRWSQHVRPMVGTELCEVSHIGVVLDGAAAVRMRDGHEFVMSAGDVFAIPGGHDSWVVGDERYVSLHISGADTYAAPVNGEPDLEGSSELMRLVGLRFDELTPERVIGHLECGSAHHHPWGSVHGGLLATVIETAATTGRLCRGPRERFQTGRHDQYNALASLAPGRTVGGHRTRGAPRKVNPAVERRGVTTAR